MRGGERLERNQTCPHCGAALPGEASFCPYCAESVNRRTELTPPSPAQRPLAEALGPAAVPLTELEAAAAGFDTVVNTIPAPVLTAPVLAALRPGSLIVDLASAPGGTDFAAAAALGHTALLAPGLPARCAPDSAGEYLAETVLEIIREGEAAG